MLAYLLTYFINVIKAARLLSVIIIVMLVNGCTYLLSCVILYRWPLNVIVTRILRRKYNCDRVTGDITDAHRVLLRSLRVIGLRGFNFFVFSYEMLLTAAGVSSENVSASAVRVGLHKLSQ